MFPSGAGVELRLRQGTMTTTVLLPEEFHGNTLGLLGKMNGNPSDDLATPDGQVVSVHSSPQKLFEFGRRCKTLLDAYLKGHLVFSWCQWPFFTLLRSLFCICFQGQFPTSLHCWPMIQIIFWTHTFTLPDMTPVLFRCFLSLKTSMIPLINRPLRYAPETAPHTAGMTSLSTNP